MRELLFGLLGGALWTRATAQLLARQAWRRGPRGLAARLGEALRSGRTWLETRYTSDLVRALFAPWVLHAGLGPESAFSGEIGRVIAFALEAAGAPVVKGGAGNAVAAFEALIREQGGEVRTRRRRRRDRRCRTSAPRACGLRAAKWSRRRRA